VTREKRDDIGNGAAVERDEGDLLGMAIMEEDDEEREQVTTMKVAAKVEKKVEVTKRSYPEKGDILESDVRCRMVRERGAF
jgi:hypothetical protein